MSGKNLIDKRICYISNNEYEYFLKKRNVQGVGLGYKKINGKCTFRKCITVFVSKKLPLNSINPKDLVPACYKYIPTDVVESGEFNICSLSQRIRPVECGYSIGPIGQFIHGTLGCLVKNNKEKAVYILSASHVLNPCENVGFGTPIVQPGVLDGGKLRRDVIANFIRSVPIKYMSLFSKPVNFVDAAIAKVSDISSVSTTVAIVKRDVKKMGSAKIGDKVFKVGRSTEYAEGHITEINITHIINSFGKKALFKEQIASDIKSDHGDSGSILFNMNMNPLGMLMGKSESQVYSVFNDIKNVTSSLDVEILTGRPRYKFNI